MTEPLDLGPIKAKRDKGLYGKQDWHDLLAEVERLRAEPCPFCEKLSAYVQTIPQRFADLTCGRTDG